MRSRGLDFFAIREARGRDESQADAAKSAGIGERTVRLFGKGGGAIEITSARPALGRVVSRFLSRVVRSQMRLLRCLGHESMSLLYESTT